ncbi:MAG: PPOX class F420-dependent oxidoreductase [Anaerolineales bacterium]|uniref:PPOX class F420-dependent oxidoreductase n=1 Tax=Candidatus Desulfolinea nitratireducens TaxID=2841698 RepID=A0A8J6NJU1_9CHLR|nr:PPOX class F420-dependent oxidoreductase [Candidatus Desulfolinea nitratireducens]MBL6961584.1 PPOX class F420-dependent oxidoreductase [Anaerolineales bacterium]
MNIPESYQDLFKDEAKAYLYLATIMPDGTPQVTPVWFSMDEKYLLINTAEGRTKDLNMQARPNVALVIQDPIDPYRYVQIRGQVAERTTEGADAHIHALSQKYRGKAWIIPPGEKRLLFKISIDKLSGR